mgnify:CR=1 FL=1
MFKLPLIDCFLDLDQITTLSQLILQIVGNLLIPLVPSVTVNILLLNICRTIRWFNIWFHSLTHFLFKAGRNSFWITCLLWLIEVVIVSITDLFHQLYGSLSDILLWRPGLSFLRVPVLIKHLQYAVSTIYPINLSIEAFGVTFREVGVDWVHKVSPFIDDFIEYILLIRMQSE